MPKTYNLGEIDITNFKGSPVDKTENIVKGESSMLHIVSDKDILIPVKENTAPFEQRVKALGGEIRVIHKPEEGHHPHILPPREVVDFIKKSFSNDLNNQH